MKRLLPLILLMMPVALMAQEVDYVSDNDGGRTTGAVWTEVGATKVLPYNLSLSLDAGFRTDDWFNEASRFDIGLGLSWKASKHWKFGVGYTFIDKYYISETEHKSVRELEYKYRAQGAVDNTDFGAFMGAPTYNAPGGTNYSYRGYNDDYKDYVRLTDSYWRTKHRFSIDAAYTYKFWKTLRISLRERYQYTFVPKKNVNRERWRNKTSYKYREPNYDGNGNITSYDETPDEWDVEEDGPNPSTELTDSVWVKEKNSKHFHVLRSRLTFEIDKKGWKVTPFAYFESFNNLGESWHFDKLRVAAGMEYALSKQQKVSISYVFNHENDDDGDEDIHAISLGYKIKF